MARTDTKPVIVGRISGLFGVRGWIRIHSFTDPREAILNYQDWLIESDGDWQSIAVVEGKPHGKTIIARLEGIDDREVAAGYVQALIGVGRSQLPETAEGEFYWSDLEGLMVVRMDGNEIGRKEMERNAGDQDDAPVGPSDLNPDDQYERVDCAAADPREARGGGDREGSGGGGSSAEGRGGSCSYSNTTSCRGDFSQPNVTGVICSTSVNISCF